MFFFFFNKHQAENTMFDFVVCPFSAKKENLTSSLFLSLCTSHYVLKCPHSAADKFYFIFDFVPIIICASFTT